MKFENLVLMSMLMVGSLGAQVQKKDGKLDLPALSLGVDTKVIGNCPLSLDTALKQAVSYLREHRKISGSWIVWFGDLVGLGQAKTAKKNWQDMVTFVKTGNEPDNSNYAYLAFLTGLKNANYKQNMNHACIYIPVTQERISPKVYLEAVIFDLE